MTKEKFLKENPKFAKALLSKNKKGSEAKKVVKNDFSIEGYCTIQKKDKKMTIAIVDVKDLIIPLKKRLKKMMDKKYICS